MSLNRSDIENIARLARLSLKEEEVAGYVQTLGNILEMVGQLDRADTAGVDPMAHPLAGQTQRLRADEVTETDRHALYQENAPRVEGGYYIVPRVIE
ncbi:MAG TPA: Asp-tRNA(Asn)/Glu-tRNA(Gln) amidotransferase subunit GatC [Dokdonella sp.]|nr:Asp-tRNA(Asn)/Glu-tRNA(Gln) amidotransferase subunit GatC [Dokdonella sp.]HNS28878.1 Asp-tRNA(Asn)/Glu-tRNA(Gln) amidotransferase subunit GatC [Steroidobacteraceae bacterium]